ncbi:PGF-pre-PGF domain-containing protein [Methanosarcina sp. UBA5]|uniref:PGF-pre-PGF domain-containing protein n=1 Tax=Methanosarcina sp. UBA5 TaxID=1915593 RepID=UPI0025DFE8DB|nr:PGF-pre-PGF domain-containing protein [Methanosarcina sp. UBA5]
MKLNLKYVCLILIIGILTIPVEAAEGYGENISENNIVKTVKFLTNSQELELFPVWTADGNYILYTVKNNESGALNSYRMKADGSEIERTRIGEGNLIGFNDLNPNGTELIVTKSDGSQSDLYRIDMNSRIATPITNDPQKSEGWGAWCRLGRKIIHTEESTGSPSQLWIVDRDGSNKTRLGTSENVGTGKDWNPLGLKVIYSANNSKEKPDLWTIEWYGTNQTQLTDTPYGEWNPAFSPDGKQIVYVSDEGGSPELWLRDIQGNYRVKLTENLGIIDAYPKWSPDGSKIVFTGHSSDNSSDIAVIELTSSAEIFPSPKITDVRIEPYGRISESEAANISVTVKNEGKSASEGYISVSFPNGERIERVEGTSSNIKTYTIGDPIQGKAGEVQAQYPSVELLQSQWDTQQEETLNIKVKPSNGAEKIIFFTRASFKNNFTGAYENDPLISTDIDQQGFNVYPYSINVSKSSLEKYSLKVILEPQDVETEAKWKITTGPDTEWHPSNYIINNLTVGDYVIQFYDLSGWKKPNDMAVTINGDSVNTGTYTQSKSGSSSSGGGHGGGGVITSLEPSRNIASKETASRYINSGSHVRFDFPMNATCITTLEFDPKKTFKRTAATIEMLKEKSVQVPQLPPGKIYKNVNIQVGKTGTLLAGNIENACIRFKVEKTWISENVGKKSEICLWRYNQTSWNRLEAQKKGEDNLYSYFEARTPGFSPFAITSYTKEENASEKAEIEQKESKKVSGNGSINKNENNKPSDIGANSEKEEKGNKKEPDSKIKNIIIVFSLLLMALLIYLGVKKRA